MIQEETTLIVADNSGAKKIKCIRVLGGSGRKYASVGDLIVVSVKTAIPNEPLKKGKYPVQLLFALKKKLKEKTVLTSALMKTQPFF